MIGKRFWQNDDSETMAQVAEVLTSGRVICVICRLEQVQSSKNVPPTAGEVQKAKEESLDAHGMRLYSESCSGVDRYRIQEGV